MAQQDPAIAEYIEDTFGGVEQCRKDILCKFDDIATLCIMDYSRADMNIIDDFFRFGFDGSGADNYFDAGSCIDGRLTSAWNWCSQIEKKKFFPIFLLTVRTNSLLLFYSL